MDTRDLEGFLVVAGFRLSTEDRGMFDGSVNYALDMRIDSIHGFAGAEFFEVVAGHAFGDVAPVGWFLELELVFLGNVEFGCGSGEFAVAQFAAAFGMYDGVGFGCALGGGDAPLLSGCLNQHPASGGAALAHGVKEIADGMGAIGVLIAVAVIADGLIDNDLFPVGVQFVGDNERQRGADYGAHFRAACDDVDCAVGFDAEKNIGVKWSAVRVGFAVRCLWKIHSRGGVADRQNQCAGAYEAFEEGAPAYIFDAAHVFFSAASLMAARMRW